MRESSDPLRRLAILHAGGRTDRPVSPVAHEAEREPAEPARIRPMGRHRQPAEGTGRSGTPPGGWVPVFVTEPELEHRPALQELPSEFGASATPETARKSFLHRRFGRLTDRWVPEPLMEARLDPGRRGVWILVLVGAVAAVVAAVGVWRSVPEPKPVQSSTVLVQTAASAGTAVNPGVSALDGSQAAPDPPAASGATGSAAPTILTELVVSVTGLVKNPGLVRLPPGSRVADAVSAAGGPVDGGDLTGVNLAEKLVDGQSVVIAESGGSKVTGAAAPAPAAAGLANTGTALVDINTAGASELDALPGVGPVTAANIVAWRQEHGRFSTVEQLQEIPGIGAAKYAQLAPLVTT